jgi:hypothetical protein
VSDGSSSSSGNRTYLCYRRCRCWRRCVTVSWVGVVMGVTAYLFPLMSSSILCAAHLSSILRIINSPGRSLSSSSFGITVRDAVVDQALVGLVVVVGGGLPCSCCCCCCGCCGCWVCRLLFRRRRWLWLREGHRVAAVAVGSHSYPE